MYKQSVWEDPKGIGLPNYCIYKLEVSEALLRHEF